MRVLFIGSKNMGAYALDMLLDMKEQGFLELVGVVARSDDDEEHWYQSVSKRAVQAALNLMMPESLEDPAFLASVHDCRADVAFCCFYPKLFRESFFSIPAHGTFNMHFAPLPRYRGAYPVPFAIIRGERMHGVTIHEIDPGMDSGRIAAQAHVPIFPDDTGFDLYHRCERHGLTLFQDFVGRFVGSGGRVLLRTQNEDDAISYVRKDLNSLEADPSWPTERLYDFVRAFDFPPFDPPFFSTDSGKVLLTVSPDRHGFDIDGCDFITHGTRRIYRIKVPPT